LIAIVVIVLKKAGEMPAFFYNESGNSQNSQLGETQSSNQRVFSSE